MTSILVTGASTGIGRATALTLAARGYRVFSGVRRLDDAPAPTIPLILDVTNPAHLADAAARLAAENLAAVINNAGHNYVAPFEYADEAHARQLLEVNFFGLYRLSQALIPHLTRYAAQHPGRTAKLINVSSIGGYIGLPWEVFYHASKFAVVGLTEGLRAELWPLNIRAVAVCPGGIKTPFLPKTEVSVANAAAALPATAASHYPPSLAQFGRLANAASRFGAAPDRVAQRIARILDQRNPALRQLVGVDAHFLFALSRLLPPAAFGAFVRRQMVRP